MQTNMNVYGFINGTERMVFAAASYEDAMELAFRECQNSDSFFTFIPSQQDIQMLMAAATEGMIH